MELHREGTLLVLMTTLLLTASGSPSLFVDATPTNYGSIETLKCTDVTYTPGNYYLMQKDGVIIFNDAGELFTTGKYSESIDGATLNLVINNIDVSDEGSYTCNHNFADSNTFVLQVESRGSVTAKLSSSRLIEVTFKQIFPNSTLVEITCDLTTIAGFFVSSVADGDRFINTWQSNNSYSTLPSSCTASVTLRTTFITDVTFATATAASTAACDTGGLFLGVNVCIVIGLIIIFVVILAITGRLPGKTRPIYQSVAIVFFAIAVCLLIMVIGGYCICKNEMIKEEESENVTSLSKSPGDTITIDCLLSGSFTFPNWRGPPNHTIYTNGYASQINPAAPAAKRLKYDTNNRSLILSNAHTNDSGDYECAYTGKGHHTIKLTVKLATHNVTYVCFWCKRLDNLSKCCLFFCMHMVVILLSIGIISGIVVEAILNMWGTGNWSLGASVGAFCVTNVTPGGPADGKLKNLASCEVYIQRNELKQTMRRN